MMRAQCLQHLGGTVRTSCIDEVADEEYQINDSELVRQQR